MNSVVAMTDPTPGWYHRRKIRDDFRNRSHFFEALRSATDAFGYRMTIALEPSACGRVKAGAILSRSGDRPAKDACVVCQRAADLA